MKKVLRKWTKRSEQKGTKNVFAFFWKNKSNEEKWPHCKSVPIMITDMEGNHVTTVNLESRQMKNKRQSKFKKESSPLSRRCKIDKLSQRKSNFPKEIFVTGDMQNAIAANSSTVERIGDGFEDTVSESEASVSDCSCTTECDNGSRVPISNFLSDLIIDVQDIFNITDCFNDLINEFTMVTKEVLRIK